MASKRSFVLLAVAFVFALLAFRAGAPHRGLAGQGLDPCAGKTSCVVVYVAPWCPNCAAIHPLIQKLASRWNAKDSPEPVGLRVLVGADTPEHCAAHVLKFGVNGQVDEGERFKKDRGVTAFPTWLVLDSSGNVLRKTAGTPNALPLEEFIHHFLNV
jgi:thiol-disulfide isomerase/thioredoxin